MLGYEARMSTDVKKLLAALREPSATVPGDLPQAQVEKARRLVAAPERATAEEVSALPEPLALAVLEAATRAGVGALAEALLTSPSKPLAKAAKKAAYQLKSSGVSVAAPPKPAAPAAAPKPEEVEELPAIGSPVSGMGERALMLARPQRGGGLQVFQLLITDEAGVVQLGRGEASRGTFRKQLKELKEKKAPVLLLSPERVRQALGQAMFMNQRSGTSLPQGAAELLRHLNVTAQERAPLPAPEPDDERTAMNGHRLHDEPEIAAWLPPEPQIRELGQRLDEAATSPLQLSEAQKQEQRMLRVRMSAQAFFTPPIRRLYAMRLWDMAELFDATERTQASALARAEARRLFHLPDAESRFAQFLFEKVLILTERARTGRGMPQPGERLT